MSPEVLGAATASLPEQSDPRLLVGFDLADDAGVVRLDSERALVQTVDFFTPIVDDPYTYGQIAAANALSDVYAMGGVPISALNILCWNDGLFPHEMLHQLLRGGLDKVHEAGAVLAGGHSVSDDEVKYGLAVTGLVHPDRIWANAGARPGDVLVLTKAIGTGILCTAEKRDECPADAMEAAIDSMRDLNRQGRDAAALGTVHACTDVTGYGLVGHSWEMAVASKVRLFLDSAAVPLLPHTLALAAAGHLTRGETSNRAYVGDLHWGGIEATLQSALVDPQTSGGLLVAVDAEDAARMVAASAGVIIGRVEAGAPQIRVF